MPWQTRLWQTQPNAARLHAPGRMQCRRVRTATTGRGGRPSVGTTTGRCGAGVRAVCGGGVRCAVTVGARNRAVPSKARVASCLDFVCPSTRTPHGAYVQMSKQKRIDRHMCVVERVRGVVGPTLAARDCDVLRLRTWQTVGNGGELNLNTISSDAPESQRPHAHAHAHGRGRGRGHRRRQRQRGCVAPPPSQMKQLAHRQHLAIAVPPHAPHA